MNTSEVKERMYETKLVNPITKRTNNNIGKILAREPELQQNIVRCTSFLDVTSTINERIYCILNDILHVPTCLRCDARVKYNKDRKQYNTYCCSACGMKSEVVAKKKRKTNLNKYGTTCSLHNPKVYKKARDAKLKKYGCEFSGQSPKLQQKRAETCLIKYGTANPSQRHYTENVLQKLADKDWLEHNHVSLRKSQWQIARELGISQTAVFYWFKRHNIKAVRTQVSMHENIIIDTLLEIDPTIKIIQSDRSVLGRQEIDIFLPEYNIGIEVNGTYWHSELRGKHKNYHLNKTVRAAKKGVTLIHLTDVQIENILPTIKHKLSMLVARNPKYIDVKDCELVELSTDDFIHFINGVELDNSTQHVDFCIGLKYNDLLLSAMGFVIKDNFEWELVNAVSVAHILDGNTAMFEWFVAAHNPTRVVCTSSNDWGFDHQRFANMGFVQSELLPPTFTRLGTDDKDRIWDCGSTLWKWENQRVG